MISVIILIAMIITITIMINMTLVKDIQNFCTSLWKFNIYSITLT